VETQVGKDSVIGWRWRYQAKGLARLDDEHRSGRPRTIDRMKAVAATLKPPPKKYGVMHWVARHLAGRLGISNNPVVRIWREYDIQPRRSVSFRFSTNPDLGATVVEGASTPTPTFWMDLVESRLSSAERQAILRGTYSSVKDLNAEFRTYVDGWNDRAHPFIRTKTADDILKKANRKKISSMEHRPTTTRIRPAGSRDTREGGIQ